MKKYIKNSIWLIVDKVVRLGLGLVVTAWVARYLEPSGYGVLSFAMSVTFVIGVLVNLGLDQFLIGEFSRKRDNALGLALSVCFVRLVLALFTCVLLGFVSRKYVHGEDYLTLMAASLWVFGTPFLSVEAFFQSRSKSYISVTFNTIALVVFAFLKLSFIYLQSSIVSFALLFALEYIVANLATFLYFLVMQRKLGNKICAPYSVVDILKYGLPLMMSSFMILVYMKVDQLMLYYLSTPEELGYYAVAVKLSEVWHFLPTAIIASFLPMVVKELDAGRNASTQITGLYSVLVCIAILAVVFVLWFGNWIIGFLFGKDYLNAYSILRVHVFGGVLNSIGMLSQAYLITRGQLYRPSVRSSIGLVVNCVSNFYLIPLYGGVGAAVATILSLFAAYFLVDLCDRDQLHHLKYKLVGLMIVPGLLGWFRALKDER